MNADQPLSEYARTSRRGFLGLSGGVGLGALAVGLGACSSDGSSDSTGPIEIGWIAPQTGLLVSSFGALLTGGVIALDEINKSGGILGRKLKRVNVDDAGSPNNEPTAVKRLQSQGVSLLCGPIGSSQALAALAISTPAKMIQTTMAETTELSDGSKYPYNYQFSPTATQVATMQTKYLVENLGITSIGVLSENTASGEFGTKVTLEVADDLGVPAPEVQTFPTDSTNLEPYVSALKDAGVEGVVARIASVPNAIQIFTLMDQMGWYPTIVATNAILGDSVASQTPPKVLDKLYGAGNRSLAFSDTTEIADAQTALAEKVNAAPNTSGQGAVIMQAPFYDYLMLLKRTAEEADSLDVAKLKSQFDKVSGYEGILGSYTFTATDHGGLDDESLCMVRAASATDSRAMNCFRELAPGQE